MFLSRLPKFSICLLAMVGFARFSAFCQSDEPKVTRYNGKVSQQFVMNRDSPIIDHATGKRISYETYDNMLKRSPGQYKTQPIFDKY